MIEKKHLNGLATYASPVCKTVAARTRRVLCGSLWGEEGEAGKIGDYEEGEDL